MKKIISDIYEQVHTQAYAGFPNEIQAKMIKRGIELGIQKGREIEREAVVAYLNKQDEISALSLHLSANCEAPDVDLSWTLPFVARDLEKGTHIGAAGGGE